MSIFKFYLLAVVLFTSTFLIGLFSGREVGYRLLLNKFGSPQGDVVLMFAFFMVVSSIGGGIAGVISSLIIIHKLGKRWGDNLNFGGHPVLKLTSLSFLTFLGLLFLLLMFYPSK